MIDAASFKDKEQVKERLMVKLMNESQMYY